MGFYTVIHANKEQAQALYDKHMKPIFKPKGFFGMVASKVIPTITSSSFSYDSEDDIGFVTLHTITSKRIEYQLRGNEPMFVEFTGFDSNVRYDVSYPHQLNEDMYKMLKEEGIKAKTKFWKGGQI